MQIRDISVKKRLLFVNFIMVFIPICLLIVIVMLVLAGFHFSGIAQQRELTLLWPEKGPALSIQYAVNSLQVKSEKKGHPDIKELEEDCHILESQGINTMILKSDKIIYETPNIDSTALQISVQEKCGDRHSIMLWTDKDFTFCYKSLHNGITILATGTIPFVTKKPIWTYNTKNIWETIITIIWGTAIIIFLGIAVFIIIATGIYLSKLLAKQILDPLSTLRFAANEIQKGNLDAPMVVQTQDELGETCQAFDRMRQELKIARETQERYEQNRKELIAGISHDLSTPLTSVKGYASGILEGIAQTDKKQRHYVEMIYKKACTMENLVKSLFLFSKLDLGSIPFHFEIVEMYSYFADFAADKRELLEERGVKLLFLAEKNNLPVRLDRIQFQRVIENLIENSIKYKSNKSVHVKLNLIRIADKVKISFSDDGLGVKDTELPKIFDSFYRTDPARTNVAKGSGLGLAIVKQIISSLKGEIWAEQTPGGGLTICILLPILEEKNEKSFTHRR
ncbi:sensor histidine kinase [Pectinatus sottacetonis]|uniref:sensor histidine kinase n=1 Tax=Pectinatus sottacetonis TaxID=1002795 RepID=UPI0018C55716|nr:HAMP domain-containing sensor histidine kinase [Pectinatus sottacetonis]